MDVLLFCIVEHQAAVVVVVAQRYAVLTEEVRAPAADPARSPSDEVIIPGAVPVLVKGALIMYAAGASCASRHRAADAYIKDLSGGMHRHAWSRPPEGIVRSPAPSRSTAPWVCARAPHARGWRYFPPRYRSAGGDGCGLLRETLAM